MVIYFSARYARRPGVSGIYLEQCLFRGRTQNEPSYQSERAKSQAYEAKSWPGIPFPSEKAPRN